MEEGKEKQQKQEYMSVKEMTKIGMMVAVLCVISPFSFPLPFSPVPISLSSLAIFLTVYVLGMKRGTFSCFVYILIGTVGVPVFSGFSGGVHKLMGPTGGYIIGYLFLAVVSGFFVERWRKQKILHLCGMALGTVLLYGFGTVWLAEQGGLSFQEALLVGVVPFVLGDVAKIGISFIIGNLIYGRLRKAGVL